MISNIIMPAPSNSGLNPSPSKPIAPKYVKTIPTNAKITTSIFPTFLRESSIFFSSLFCYLKNHFLFISLDTIPSFLRIHLVNTAARGCVKVSCGICSHIVVIIQEKLDHSYPQDFIIHGAVF